MSYALVPTYRRPAKPRGFLSGLGTLLGLGQKAPGTTAPIDNTGRDWAAAAGAAGSLIGGLIGGGGAAAPAPEAAVPVPVVAPVSASPDWYWPVIIGVGVAVLGGIGYMSYNVKAPVRANRGRRRGSRRSRRVRRNRTSPPPTPTGKTVYCIGTPGGDICLTTRKAALAKYSALTTEFGPHYTFFTAVR